LFLAARGGERGGDRRLLALAAGAAAGVRTSSGRGRTRLRSPAGGAFTTLLRQRPKYRRASKKPLAFEGDSHK
jgi:hypothetical protein